MPTPIDCRIGGTADFQIKAGETWQVRMNPRDANDTPIPLSGFLVGPLEMFDKNTDTVLLTIETENLLIDGTGVILSTITPETLRKSIGNYFQCPFLPPGGGPRAIISGKIKIDARN